MKRLLLSIALFVVPILSAYAYDFSAVAPSGQTLYYNIVNGNAEVVCPGTRWHNPYGGYTEPSGSLVIPSSVTYGGQSYSVTSIGTSAFCDCEGLVSVTIPEGVTHIGDAAFLFCTGLTSPLIIPNTVTTIETNAFNGCSSLTSVRIGSGIVTMGNEIFRNCISLTKLYCLSQYPPSIGNYVFDGVNSNFNIYVPCESYQNYLNNWSNYGTIHCTFQFNLIVSSNDSTWGTGSYVGLSDSIAEITAIPNYGYHFDHWSYGSTANPDTIMLTDDATITAIFAKNQYSVTGTTNDSTKGLVSGSATVDYLDTVTLTATANYGYQFVRWSDYSTENPRRIAATANITKTAIFDFNQYNLTVQADTSIHGSCNGGGSYNYLSERTIRANANYGYHFTQWNDGDTNNPRVITLTQDTAFIASFSKNQYTLTVSSNDTTLGSVVGSGTYEYLDTVSISATTIEHYHFVRWDDGNTLNPRNIIVTSDISRSAIFAIDTHSVTLQAANITHGTCSGSGQYQYGTAATVEALPYSGYQFLHWSDGSTYNPYTFAVVNNIQLTAHFYAVGTPYQDTLYIDTLTIHDTVYFHDTTFVPVHDTTVVYITDSILIHDTVFVHDTIFVGVDEVDAINAKIYTSNGQIVVDGAERNTVYLYDVNGRILATKQDEYSPLHFNVPATGTYLVKIGNHSARRVVVVR